MRSSATQKFFSARFAALILILLVSIGLVAWSSDTKSTKPAPAPAKPAAPAAKPAAAPHPAGSAGASHPSAVGGASTTGHPGATTGHPGPTTANPSGAHVGPTTGNPTGTRTSHPTAGGGNPTTGNAHGGVAGTGGSGGSAARPPIDRHPAPPVVGGTVGGAKPPGPGGSRPSTTGMGGKTAPAGAQVTQTKTGNAVQKRATGQVREVHVAKSGMDIHHGINGTRQVSVVHADGTRVVAERGRPGYVQRGYTYHGREFAARSYYYHGQVYNRYYNHYYYGGRYMAVYAPYRYYPAPFYGWVYNPWYQPIYYSWGWGGYPWYGYYGFYFAPYPSYLNASLWLTDYLVSQDLAASYQAQQEAGMRMSSPSADASANALTPEVKQQIAEEVKNQIALENAEAQQNAQGQAPDPASSGINRMLTDGHPHVFVVGGALDVVDASSFAECALSDGDALELATPPPADATEANVVVLSSKGGNECHKGSTVKVSLNDLQEMQNHMRDMVDRGLQELQAKQGKGQVPALPPTAAAPPVEAGYAQAAPSADPKGAEEITKQLAEADQAEREVTTEVQQQAPGASPAHPSDVTSAAAPAAAPIEVKAGQTIEQVTAELGPPVKVIDLGTKKTYIYKDMKVIFKDGKVADVQ